MTDDSKILFAVVVVESLSRAQLLVTPRTAAHQAPQSFTVPQGLLDSCPLNQ